MSDSLERFRVAENVFEGECAAADQGDGGRCDREEHGVLPAAIRRVEDPAIASVRPRGAEQHRDERGRDIPRADPDEDQRAANQLAGEDDVGKRTRQAEAFEKFHRAGQREHVVLQQGVRHEHDPERGAKREGAVRGGA
jgi:hypothetical protein